MRCQCCDTILYNPTGYVVLEDGSRVEDPLCAGCRNLAFYPVDEKQYALDNITNEVNSLLSPSGVTMVPDIPY